MGQHIRYEAADGIGTITIDRPEKRNAMTYAVLRDFGAAIREAGEDDAARVVIVTGVPGSFCAGTDLADLDETPTDQRGGRGGGEAPWALVACPKPVIGAIDGPAVGMGAEFTSMCDLRIATPNARFAWNFSHRGLVPDTGAGTWLLPRIIGVPATLRLLYTGEMLGADAALQLGYVQAVVPSEELQAEARQLAQSLMVGSPLSHRLTKELLYQGLGSDVATHLARNGEAMATCFQSEDHREGVAAFLERRPANFTGR
jgi:enoyl-CoA hydratase/carnithine racemase